MLKKANDFWMRNVILKLMSSKIDFFGDSSHGCTPVEDGGQLPYYFIQNGVIRKNSIVYFFIKEPRPVDLGL
jgi:hypothetical protein